MNVGYGWAMRAGVYFMHVQMPEERNPKEVKLGAEAGVSSYLSTFFVIISKFT